MGWATNKMFFLYFFLSLWIVQIDRFLFLKYYNQSAQFYFIMVFLLRRKLQLLFRQIYPRAQFQH